MVAERFNLAQGYSIDNLFDIHQGYEINDTNILANISAENLFRITSDLCRTLEEPLFFFLEVPCDDDNAGSVPQKDVYYLDNCNFKVILAVLKRYGDLLFNDGIIKFGFASHKTDDEIYFLTYNIINIYSARIDKFVKVFEKCSIPRENKIKTAWDVLSDDNPATCASVEFNGESISDVINNLTDAGLYFSHKADNV